MNSWIPITIDGIICYREFVFTLINTRQENGWKCVLMILHKHQSGYWKSPPTQLNVHNLLCWLAGRNSAEFCMANIHRGKRFASVEPGRRFINVFRKSTNFVHGTERLEKLIIPQPVMKFPALKVHYTFSQELATCVYLESDESSPHYFILFAQDIFYISSNPLHTQSWITSVYFTYSQNVSETPIFIIIPFT